MENTVKNIGTIVPDSSPNGGLNVLELIKERIKIIKAKQVILK